MRYSHLEKNKLRQEDQPGGEQAALIKPRPKGKAYDGRCPEACRRGRPFDPVSLGDNDGPRANKAHARDDLGAQTGNVRIIPHDQEKVLSRQGGHGRSQADKDMGAEACRTALELPFHADGTATKDREDHPQTDRNRTYIPQLIKNR